MTRVEVEVVRAGPLTTVQDHGRPGYAHLGVTRSGALDQAALSAANAAVGNAPAAAGLEVTTLAPGVGGCVLRPTARTRVALAGAPCRALAGSIPAPFGSAFWLEAGQPLEVLAAESGARTYVAIEGGLALAPELGSQSTCLLTGMGPAPLREGDVLPIGEAPGPRAPHGAARHEAAASGDTGADAESGARSGAARLPVWRGPRDDWFTEAARATLLSAAYTVTRDSNRVGLRLDGPRLERAREDELESEPMVLGAVQVPPSGRPIVFLNDHPTTGGYPVIGVVDPTVLALAAQLRAGDTVTFGDASAGAM